jgi:hypothetical protein
MGGNIMAEPKRSEDRNYTPKPALLPVEDVELEELSPPLVKPEKKKDEGSPFLDELEIGPEDPGVDLNEEQQR